MLRGRRRGTSRVSSRSGGSSSSSGLGAGAWEVLACSGGGGQTSLLITLLRRLSEPLAFDSGGV